MLRLRTGVRTDVGRVRRRNEDAYLLREGLAAIADGMGGHRGGDVASRLALETLEATVPETGASPADLVEGARAANRALLNRAAESPDLQGMGTTLVAAMPFETDVFLAHVGDSRAYLARGDRLYQLTEDHTLVHRMVAEGRLSPQEAAVHPARNIVTRAIGGADDVAVDEITVGVRAGDRLLLCSDGLTGMVDDAAVLDILRREPDPQAACDALVRSAVAAGGEDNVTVIVLDFESEAGTEEAERDEEAAEPSIETTTSWGTAEPPADASLDDADARGARRPRRRWVRVGTWAAAIAILVAGGLTGLHAYLDRQWYVGEDSGHVAVFQGIPVSVAGVHLSHVSLVSGVPAAAAERLQPYSNLPRGITVNDRSQAIALLTQIRSDVALTANLGVVAPPVTPSVTPSRLATSPAPGGSP